MHYNGFCTDEKGLEVSQGRTLLGKARAGGSQGWGLGGGAVQVSPRYWGTRVGRAGCPQSVAEAAEGKRTAVCVYCRQEEVLKDAVSCLSWGDVTELSLTRRSGGSWGQGS